jgi:hypothetical protein
MDHDGSRLKPVYRSGFVLAASVTAITVATQGKAKAFSSQSQLLEKAARWISSYLLDKFLRKVAYMRWKAVVDVHDLLIRRHVPFIQVFEWRHTRKQLIA